MSWIARFFPALSGLRRGAKRRRSTVVIATVWFGMVPAARTCRDRRPGEAVMSGRLKINGGGHSVPSG